MGLNQEVMATNYIETKVTPVTATTTTPVATNHVATKVTPVTATPIPATPVIAVATPLTETALPYPSAPPVTNDVEVRVDIPVGMNPGQTIDVPNGSGLVTVTIPQYPAWKSDAMNNNSPYFLCNIPAPTPTEIKVDIPVGMTPGQTIDVKTSSGSVSVSIPQYSEWKSDAASGNKPYFMCTV